MRTTLFSVLMVLLAAAAWCGFAALAWQISNERFQYAELSLRAEAAAERGESAARLHTLVQSTAPERARLESVVGVSILDAVEMIERAGNESGISVTINEATPLGTTPQGLSTVGVALAAEGSFPALMRTLSLLEVLPFPATIEQFDLTKSDKNWRLSARLKIITSDKK